MKKHIILLVVFLFSLRAYGIVISGSGNVCPGYIYQYSVDIPGAVSFQWTLPTGWYFLQGQGTNSVSVNCNVNVGNVCVKGYDSNGNLLDSACINVAWGGSGGGWFVRANESGANPCYQICDRIWTLQMVPQGPICQGDCGNGIRNLNVYFAVFLSPWPSTDYVGTISASSFQSSGSASLFVTLYVYAIDTTFGLNNRILVSGGGSCGQVNNSVSIYLGSRCPINISVSLSQNPLVACIGDTITVLVNQSPLVTYPFNHMRWDTISGCRLIASTSTLFSARFVVTGANPRLTYYGYVVRGFNPTYCVVAWGSLNVNTRPNPIPEFNIADTSICMNACASFINQSQNATSYQWSFGGGIPASGTTPNPNNVCYPVQGRYPVTLTAYNGNCRNSITRFITVLPKPDLVVTPADTVCAGQSATLLATGASSYLWQPDTTLQVVNDSTAIVTPFQTTNYQVTGTSNECDATASVSVTINPVPSLLVVSQPAICIGESAVFIASGAASYSWSPANSLSNSTGSSVIASPQTTTTYTVIGISNHGCADTALVTLTVKARPTITASNPPAICEGQSATLTATGAESYSWSPFNALSSSSDSIVIANPLSTITYFITGILAGCSSSTSITIIVNPVPEVTVLAPGSICFGDSAQLIASGAMNYSWSPPFSLNSTSGSVVIANPTSTTNYLLIGATAGCSDTVSVLLIVNPLPEVAIAGPTFICPGQSAILNASGADSYVWSSSTPLNVISTASVMVQPTSTTIYSVVGTTNGCRDSLEITLTVDELIPNFLCGPMAGCSPLLVTYSNQSVAAANSTYRWDFGDGTYSIERNPTHLYSENETYITKLTIVSPNGCIRMAASTLIQVHEKPQADFTFDPRTGDIRSFISFKGFGSTSIQSWEWDFGDGFGKSFLKNPAYRFGVSGDYLTRLIVMNDDDCIDTAMRIITIHDLDFEIWIPNSFTPNGDGLNDVFTVSGRGIKDFEMAVFDRWGIEIFSTVDIRKGWNGKKGESEFSSPSGFYFYVIKVKDNQNSEHVYHNTIQLQH